MCGQRAVLRWGTVGTADESPTARASGGERPGYRQLQEALLRRHRHGLRAGVDAQLVEDRSQVVVHGAGRNEDLAPDRFAGEALRHQPQHLLLARRQPGGERGARTTGRALRPMSPGFPYARWNAAGRLMR
jgi:hypothetical protein